MSLNLNYDAEKKVDFEVYKGKNVGRMPDLVKDGRVPMSSRAVMKRRLEVLNHKTETPQKAKANEEIKDSWFNMYVDTGDGVFYHPDGPVKMVLDAPIMRELTPESHLIDGALRLGANKDESVARYEALDGQEFKRDDLDTLSTLLTPTQAKKHPVWKVLAGGDQDLLNEYVDAIFKVYGISQGMAVCVDNPEEVAHGRLWCLGSSNNRSNAGGINDLDDGGGRLVGVCAGGALEDLPRSGDASENKVIVPSLEQVLGVLKSNDSCLSKNAREQLEKDYRTLYRRE